MSIVVPVYNVEEYLDECLTSIIQQTYRNLEIIVVDDGSRDRSHEIARSFARWDPRIRIIRQQNRGLGGARNTGTAAAHGRYLCFADSDDALPPEAIELMVRSLRKSRSDFAVGAPIRMANGRTWAAGWVKDVHAVDRVGIRLNDFPDVLKDVFAWNKLFRTEFFRRVVEGFPEGIRYEDQEPTAKAYVAGRFDVLAAPVYYWRERENGTSITQQKADPRDLRDRLLVKNKVSDVISAGASRQTHDVWLAKAIGFDLRLYFEEVPRTDEAYFNQLRDGARHLAERATPGIWRLVPILDRIPSLALLAGRREDVAAAVLLREEYGWYFPTELRNGQAYLQRSFLDRLGMDFTDEQLRLGPADLRVIAKVTSLWWVGRRLSVEGHAYLTNVPYELDSSRTDIELVSADGVRVPVPVRRRPDPVLAVTTNDAFNDHRESGFAIDVDPAELPIGAAAPWHLEVTVRHESVSASTVLREVDLRGIAGTKPVAAADGAVRWMAGFEEHNYLTLEPTSESGMRIAALRTDGREVAITVEDPSAKVLRLTCRSLRRAVEVTGRPDGEKSGRVTFQVSLPGLLRSDDHGAEHLWSARVSDNQGGSHRLSYSGSVDDLHAEVSEHHMVRPSITRAGTLRLAQNLWWAVADDVRVDDESLTVTGRISAAGATGITARMVSATETIDSDQAQLDVDEETFSIRFPFNEGGRVPSVGHGFSVRVSLQFDGRWQERWLKASVGMQHRFPAEADALRYGLTFTRTRKAAALWIRFRPPYRDEERGRLAQRRLHEQFRLPVAEGGGLTPELRNAVLFESFNGRSVGDSVLAIHDQIRRRGTDLELFWTVADLNTEVPPGATPLLVHSRAYLDVLHNSRYLINNNNFPFYFRKRPGQVYVQTWHGTPLKKIGNDVPGANLSLSYRELMRREPGYWDVLLAQNDFAARVLPEAFGYHGPTLNVGYPRNDVLTGPASHQRRATVRARLGLADDQPVALYAPTWRDNVSVATGYAMVSHLDFARARAALGRNSTILLRGHANTAHDRMDSEPGVINVTEHPDVNDLILASDLLITDYSSIMFDYCVTGKPILFLTPDLDQYRTVTRGFYLDLEEVAPGPVCPDNDTLAEALGDLAATKINYADRYARFVSTYAPRDDGSAAARVVDALFGEGLSSDGPADDAMLSALDQNEDHSDFGSRPRDGAARD
ncbi:CDP-glycerol glycerophosphotransferase family protein [Microlunatus sp. Gsoil 973]|uniref:bifunctional glycosyltransferase/CDP-glycerol:glycerophosphate glycerophosphotransferase n=1 Tax=Microlunatus sp. Gsoil 973 TaxID=2672569 RepID=UPI0012B452B2|nr:CDP-glycerol glycerophosphotransferase family protein [Microlunatus sp. Gsoil 973]QGN32939.1 glycosyltransferase [Microlunatus sp. Gsoil 973]